MVLPQHESLDQVVPTAAATHFDDVYVYFAMARSEHRQFGSASCLPRGGTKLVTENIVHQPQILTTTDGTPSCRCFSVESTGTDQVRRGVTHLVGTDPARGDVSQQRPTLKRVIYVRRYRLHYARVLGVIELSKACVANVLLVVPRRPETEPRAISGIRHVIFSRPCATVRYIVSIHRTRRDKEYGCLN